MKIHYKTHYILNQSRNKYVAMKHSAFNIGTFPTLELAMLACDNNGSIRSKYSDHTTQQKMNDLIMTEYYSAKCEMDEDGKMIPEYGKVSNSDLKQMEGYNLPVHRSLWK